MSALADLLTTGKAIIRKSFPGLKWKLFKRIKLKIVLFRRLRWVAFFAVFKLTIVPNRLKPKLLGRTFTIKKLPFLVIAFLFLSFIHGRIGRRNFLANIKQYLFKRQLPFFLSFVFSSKLPFRRAFLLFSENRESWPFSFFWVDRFFSAWYKYKISNAKNQTKIKIVIPR